MTSAATWPASLSETAPAIDNPRGYAPEVVAQLTLALTENAPMRPDARHAHLFVLAYEGYSFYVSPLPSGKILLLAYWRS